MKASKRPTRSTPIAKRKQPKVAQLRFLEHLPEWQTIFRARVSKILPGMVRAETKKMLREADALYAAYPGTISESFHAQYKDSMKDLVQVQQLRIAEGRVFRELFADIEPLAMDAFLDTQTINPAWLVGFSNDKAVRQRYEQETRKEQAAALHATQLAGARANTVKADAAALKAVEEWRKDPVRCSSISRLPQADVINKYLKQRVKPPRRQAERLRAMLREGRIK